MHRRDFLHLSGLFPLMGAELSTGRALAADQIAKSPNVREFFYRPQNAWAADFIPLHANGEFQLFFLLDWRDKSGHGEGTPWYRISTSDFVQFKEHGETLKRGSVSDQDLYVFTGSAIHADDGYHIFYTGHNPHLRQQGKPEQAIMHAVSPDLLTWTKLPQQIFFSPSDRYEKDDWRDPFVFWNEEKKEYNMLVAARTKEGEPLRRGVTGLCSSKDLAAWRVDSPFYSPHLYYAHECPDLFKMGDWWYLIFSEFSDEKRTRYVMSRSLDGPWLIPARDDFDGTAFYAAKTASDGKDRYLFGWNPTRSGKKDDGAWEWGGNLVVHQLIQEADGQLAVKMPATVGAAFSKPASMAFNSGVGQFHYDNDSLRLEARGTYAAAIGGAQPRQCLIKARAHFREGAKAFGLMFRTSEDFQNSYYVRVEPQKRRLVFDKWPRARVEVTQMEELERPFDPYGRDGVELKVIIDGDKGVAYLNDTVAMNFRAYDLPEGRWGFFATDGDVSFTSIAMTTL